ncbi:AAA+ family ATPase [Gymnodinialimonas sp. 2305UL16-5]|uniref:AAA+ family ATPase n=1 Tax=Gymnodinialimonas mytili TaxID=3126503 RepID=UPI0030A83E7C
MKQLITATITAGALALASPAAAQDENQLGDGLDRLGEGMGLILEGLMEEMRPMLEEARPYFEDEVLPFLDRMGELMDDLSSYELPERLPNGDIIIRRSEDAPPFEPELEPGPGGDVEL